MKKLQIIFIAFIAICFSLNVNGQIETTVQVGPSIPMGDFGSDDFANTEASAAGTGFNFGAGFRLPIGSSGVGVFGGLDIHYNALNSDYEEELEDNVLGGMAGGDVDVTHVKYLNLPVSIGVDYQYKVAGPLSVFGRAGLVYNTLFITPYDVEVDGNTLVSGVYDPAGNSGIRVGFGALLSEKLTLAFDYFALGEHTIEGTMTDALGDESDIELDRKIDMLTLTVGVRF